MNKLNISHEEMPAIALGAAVIILIIFLLMSQLTALKDGYTALAGERNALTQNQASFRQLRQLESRAGQMQQSLNELHKAFPDRPGEDLLLNELSNIAAATGSDLLQVQFAERVPQEKYVEMPVFIDLTANYNDLIDMLDYLQNGSRSLRIEEFTLTGGEPMPPGISVNIKATAFFTES